MDNKTKAQVLREDAETVSVPSIKNYLLSRADELELRSYESESQEPKIEENEPLVRKLRAVKQGIELDLPNIAEIIQEVIDALSPQEPDLPEEGLPRGELLCYSPKNRNEWQYGYVCEDGIIRDCETGYRVENTKDMKYETLNYFREEEERDKIEIDIPFKDEIPPEVGNIYIQTHFGADKNGFLREYDLVTIPVEKASKRY